MPKLNLSNKLNTVGSLFVDTSCIDCGTCFHIAPQIFFEKDNLSVVSKQPQDLYEWTQAKEAIVSCPTNSIGVHNPPRHFKEAKINLPRHITQNIYYCGYTSKESFGASSYLIKHPRGNILVDCPRYNTHLANTIESMGGIDLMFLTHRDDVADHEKYAEHFKCKRVIHKQDIDNKTKNCEIILSGEEAQFLTSYLLAIPTPGHTKGHMALLYKDHYLFTGDHLFYDQMNNKIYSSKNVNWYSWPRQLNSIKKLEDYHFDWIFPGHGGWVHKDEQILKTEMSQLVSEYNISVN